MAPAVATASPRLVDSSEKQDQLPQNASIDNNLLMLTDNAKPASPNLSLKTYPINPII